MSCSCLESRKVLLEADNICLLFCCVPVDGNDECLINASVRLFLGVLVFEKKTLMGLEKILIFLWFYFIMIILYNINKT